MKQVSLFFVFCMLITRVAHASEVERLESEGWDMSRCQVLPASTYNLKIDSDRIPVKFLNDTGGSVRPAYLDLKGNVKFRNGSKSADEVWSDRTVRNTNWIWFDSFDRCIGMANATKDWAEGYQLISQLAQPVTSDRASKSKDPSVKNPKVTWSAFCTEGDCTNGIGKISVPTGGYIMASFKAQQASGFAFQVLSEKPGKEMFCEINLAGGIEVGVRHCIAMQMKAHIFMYPKLNGRENGRTIVVAPNGQVLSQKVYENGKEVTLDLYPNDDAAVRDGRNYLVQEVIPQLGQRREKRDRRIDGYIKAELWNIPGFELAGGPLSTRVKTTRRSSVVASNIGERKPKTRSSTSGLDITNNSTCIEGNCVSGIGKLAFSTGEYIIAHFNKGKASGLAIQVLKDEPGKEMFCEINVVDSKLTGLHHCFFAQFKFHIFRDPQVDGEADGRVMMLDSKGSLFFHEIYDEGEKITREVYSDKAEALSEGKNFLARTAIPAIGALRADRNPEIDKHIPRDLWLVPGFKLAGGRLTSSNTSLSIEDRELKREKLSKPALPPRATQGEPRVSSKPKPKLKKADPIDSLVEKAAELNRGARQYNPLYKLERVYVDRDAFQLVYEFRALKSINKLNRKAMEIGAAAAYCKSFKMLPFREQKMPSRWSYLDSDGNNMTVITRMDDC